MGDRAGGTALVAGVVHDLGAGRWTTKATLGLPAAWRSDAPDAGTAPGALTAAIQGLHVGTVLGIVPDDTNLLDDAAMIKVRLPLVGDAPAELWARHAQPYASKGAGLQFLPEIGDEVVVGFLSADPGAPVILGSLHSTQQVRAQDASERNGCKTLQTRSGVAITFDDDRKTLSVATPGGRSFVLDDTSGTVALADARGNSVTLGEDGIVIDSTGTLDLRAVHGIRIAAQGDLGISGSNLTARGENSASVTAGASAELSADGETTVKGAMVRIN